MFKKSLFHYILLFSSILINPCLAAYELSQGVEEATYSSASNATLTENVSNPVTDGINANALVTQVVKSSDNSTLSFIRFDLPSNQYITSLTGKTVEVDIMVNTLETTPLYCYLRHSVLGSDSIVRLQSSIVSAGEWHRYSYDFSDLTIPSEVVEAGGYDQIMFGLGITPGNTYFLNKLSLISEGLTSPVSCNAEWLKGSWGVRLIVPGGARLDTQALSNDWVAGAQEIVDELPAIGHVITSYTHPAHGYYFCLRDNPYVDIASEIHPDFVPSLENEQIILDVINVFRNAGKKVILYVATDGPSARGGTPDNAELSSAWENYYTETWGGDEYAAYKNLCKGFFERFKGLADGYWLDHLSAFPGTEAQIADFVDMIREIDPNVSVATNLKKSYFEDGAIKVDTDNSAELFNYNGYHEEHDSRDYSVIKLEANDAMMDFTPGHPTPLATGAPPSSWAYEELTIDDMIQNPADSYDGTRQTVKHFWVPMRSTWTGSRSPLMFDNAQAHRFTRNITDAEASITWANTTVGGHISSTDLAVLKYIQDNITATPTPYERPEGAFYVGETLSGFDSWIREHSTSNDHTRSGDADGDGRTNLLEYAFVGDPNAKETDAPQGALPPCQLSGSNLSYVRRRDSGVDYIIETSDTLDSDSWTTLEVDEVSSELDTDFETINLSIPESLQESSKLFMRIRIEDTE